MINQSEIEDLLSRNTAHDRGSVFLVELAIIPIQAELDVIGVHFNPTVNIFRIFLSEKCSECNAVKEIWLLADTYVASYFNAENT